MRALRLLVALVVALPLAGCAEMAEGMARLTGNGAPDIPLPYYREYADTLGPQYAREFTIPVEAGADRLVATIDLQLRDGGADSPVAAPATLELVLLSPSGEALQATRVGPSAPSATLALDEPVVGEHRALVRGVGASQTLDGVRYGAAYALALEVAYG